MSSEAMTPPPFTEGLIERLNTFTTCGCGDDDWPQLRYDTVHLIDNLARTPPTPEGPPDDVLVEALQAVAPYLDAIVCYASTMDEHEPNRIAFKVREALARFTQPKGGSDG